MTTSRIPTKAVVALGAFLVVLFALGTFNAAFLQQPSAAEQASGGSASSGTATDAYTAPAAAPTAPGKDLAGDNTASILPYPQTTSSSVSPDRQVIRTSYLSIIVDDLRARIDSLSAKAKELGGFASSSAIATLADGTEQASVSLRVPSDKAEGLLQTVRAQALRIASEQTSNDDATDQLVDIGARLASLRETDDQYAQILKQAANVDDILKITQARSDVRTQIEQLAAQQENLKNQVSFSTVSVTMNTETGLPSQPAWRPAQQVRLAWEALLRGLQDTGNLLIVGLVTLPLALLWLGLLWLALRAGWRIVGWLRRRLFNE